MNTSKRKNVLATMVGLFATAGGVGSALGQGDEAATAQGRIDEIIVTANKREQRLIDVPISVAVLSGETLTNRGMQSISDLSYGVPNLSVREIGAGVSTIVMRGVGNFLQGSGALVGIYLDEASVSAIPQLPIDLRITDLDSVEVLRGPQGTLYGQGSVGGTIRYKTNDPTFDSISGKLGLSVYSTKKGSMSEEFTGIFNLPVIDDVLAFRLAATYENRGGWIDQPAIGRDDINDSELTNIRLKGLWQPSDDLTVKSIFLRHRNQSGHENVANIAPISESLYQNAVDPTASPDYSNDYDLYNLTLNYDLGFASLTSISTYMDVEKRLINESQFVDLACCGLLEILALDTTFTADVFSQEIRLNSNNDGSFAWSFGAFYSDLERISNSLGADLLFPGLGDFFVPGTPTNGVDNSKSLAIFGDVSYELTERLVLGVGVRSFEDEKEAVSDGALSGKDTFENISPKVYLTYSLTDSATIYSSIAEGFRSGGFNGPLAVSLGANPSFKPENLLSYELGIKSVLMDRRLSSEVALFFSDYTDYISQSFDASCGCSSLGNTNKAEVKGIEWNLQWLASERLSVGFAGNVTDGEFTEAGLPPSTLIEGDQLDFVPKYSLSLTVDYNFDWSDSAPGFIRVDYNRQGENSFINRTAGLAQPVNESTPLNFLNASFGIEWESLSAQLFAKNILDEHRATAADISGILIQNRPRSMGVKLQYEF